jgi:UDP-glucose 4-epimerase
LVEALVLSGRRVKVADDLSSGSKRNLTKVMERIEFHQGDVRDAALMKELVAGAETVFHMAGMSSVSQSQLDPSLCLDVNGRGTLNVMALAAEAGVRRLVYSSSSAVYGDLPGPHSEDMAPRPDSPYAAVKLLGEHLGQCYRSSGLETVSLRFFNVYGPRQSADGADAGVVPIFINDLLSRRSPTIYGDGRQTRDFVHVADVVRAALLAAEIASVPDSAINVATGVSASILQVLELLSETFGASPQPIFAPARAGDPLVSEASTKLAEETLGFKAEIALETGLTALLAKRD